MNEVSNIQINTFPFDKTFQHTKKHCGMAFGVSDANFLRKDVTRSFSSSSSSSSFDFFEDFDSDTKRHRAAK